MLYGNGSVGGIINDELEAARPARAEHRPARSSAPTTSSSPTSTSAATSPRTAGSATGWSALGRTADGPDRLSPATTPPAVMPSLTWAPDDATSVTLLGLWQKNDTNPMIQFLLALRHALVGATLRRTATSCRPTPSSASRASTTTTARRRAATLFAEPPLRRGLGRRRLAALHSTAAPTTQQAYWAYDNFETGRYNPDGTINRTGESGRTTTRTPGSATCTPRADFALGATAARGDVRRRLHRRPLQLRLRLRRDRRPDRPLRPGLYRVVGAGRHRRLSRILAQAAVGLCPGPHHLPRPPHARRRPALRLDPAGRADLGRPRPAAAPRRRRSSRPAPRLLYAIGQRRRALCQLFGDPSARRTPAPTAPATRSSRPAAQQYEAGVKYQPPGTSSLFTAAVFEITKSNLLPGRPAQPELLGAERRGQVRAASSSARRRTWRGLTFDAGYTYLDTEDEAGDALRRACRRTRPRPGCNTRFAGRLAGPRSPASASAMSARLHREATAASPRRASRSTTRCSATSGTATR